MTVAKLPVNVGVDALVAITFDTQVNPSMSGVSGRKSQRQIALRNYTVSIGPDDALEVQKIYMSYLGQRYPVGLRDWTNYAYTDEVLDWSIYSTDVTRASLRRKFQAATGSRAAVYKRILIVDESEVATTIKINGFTPTSGTSFTIVDPGIIQINRALTPGDILTASGQCMEAVCFVDDLTATVHRGPDSSGTVLYTYQDVHLREVAEAEYLELTA